MQLADRYREVRAQTDRLCETLTPEDAAAQSMPDASPAKWHLAHTTWFFETFLLERELPAYRSFHPDFRVLFNSYYNSVGEQHPRPQRGLLTRPGLDQVRAYRSAVDERVLSLLEGEGGPGPDAAAVVEVGLNHEQQHQELLLTDVKHLFSCNPLWPAYRPEAAPAHGGTASPGEQTAPSVPAHGARPLDWHQEKAGLREIGYAGPGFAFDNERPRHRVHVEAFAIASRLVTCGEFQEFMHDGGYERPELWLADGWAAVQREGWRAPLYWQRTDPGSPGDGGWRQLTLSGPARVEPASPVCHVSYYEADAFARWAGGRLPTEAEWEIVAAARADAGADPARRASGPDGNFLESGRLHPAALDPRAADGVHQLFGDVWEWTQSAYAAYAGYAPPPGALGEYNGKFMCNQQVLRGGSCVTPASHIRATYRNFFYPTSRWQFSGIRLARDVA